MHTLSIRLPVEWPQSALSTQQIPVFIEKKRKNPEGFFLMRASKED